MAGEVITVYAGQQPPESWDASVFIGRTTPHPSSSATPWQSEVIALLRKRWTNEGRLVVFVPEPSGCVGDDVVGGLIDWYDDTFQAADIVMFWWPDDADARFMSANLPAWNDSQRVVHGTPSHTPQSRYLLEYADGHTMFTETTLAGMVSVVLDKIGSGAHRIAGERQVPLSVWQTDSFQRWYSAQTSAGNILLGARQVWTFSAGAHEPFLLYWALHVRVYVRAEDRVKSNEVVISRPDISVVALYRRGATIEDTTIVLVREFRSPASTPDGFVHELPGGSGTAEADALDQAVRETEEETGLVIDVRRIQAHGSRQLAATVSAHHAHLFAAEITGDELAWLRATRSTPHGVGDTERTWTEIATLSQIRDDRLVDWATLGMIAQAVLDRTALPPA
jgi:8-oxo-dGTP pyrophosphatase MutT (NUDIX family)/uncharacterized glyoxalase superfamily protein PhnB